MTQPDEPTLPASEAASLWEVAALFLRLGLTAFGGPAAHIALMRQEVVERRKWLTEAQFLDRIGAANLIPGPSSTEVAIEIGFERAGWAGLLLAGVCFILPAALLVSLIAWAYVRFGRLPVVLGVLYGVKPVVIAVIVQALWGLGKTALKTRFLIGVGTIATVAAFAGVYPLLILLGAGLLMLGATWRTERKTEGLAPLLGLLLALSALAIAPTLLGKTAVALHRQDLPALFLVFLKLGSVVYGSGYVLLAFLRTELVRQLGWLTAPQLLDAVAVGQVTPGPVFTTATFIGYVIAGPKGAFVATVGMFLPAFLLVACVGRFVPRLRQSALAGAFLDGVNAAALALMVSVTWELGRDALRDGMTVLLAVVSAVLLLRYRVNSAWLILGGAVVGAIALAVR